MSGWIFAGCVIMLQMRLGKVVWVCEMLGKSVRNIATLGPEERPIISQKGSKDGPKSGYIYAWNPANRLSWITATYNLIFLKS